MTDSVVDDRRGWAGLRPNTDRVVAVACFGLACAIGLVFAFVGLATHGLWFDELFTARLLEATPGTTLFGRRTSIRRSICSLWRVSPAYSATMRRACAS